MSELDARHALPAPFEGRRRRLLLRLIGNGIAQGAAAGAFAFLLRHLLDDTSGTPFSPTLGIALFATVLCSAGLRWWERVDSERLGQSYVRDVRLRLFDHLSRVAPERLRRIRHGNLSLRFVGDMSALRFWISRGLARVWVAGTMVVGALAALCALDVRFALATVAVLAAGALAMRIGANALDASVRAARKRQGRFAASINEQLLRLPMIQAYARRDAEREAILERSRRLWNASLSLARASGFMIAATAATAGLATVAVAMIASGEATHSRGTLLAAVLLVSLLATPLHRLGRVFELWRSARVAREKLEGLLRLGPIEKNAEGALRLPKGRGAIEFRGLAIPGMFGPIDGRVRAGARLLIEAERHAAAAAVLWAIPRLIRDVEGAVRIDGQDIAITTLGSLRRAAVLIGAELPPIRGTLLDNLRYRAPQADDAEVERAIDACGLREIVASLPRGMSTPLGDGGRLLSAAERWRLCWARALLGRPRILLLEDADAQRQGGNEAVFMRMLDAFDGTVVMSARAGSAWPPEFAIWPLPPPRAETEACAADAGRGDLFRADNVRTLPSRAST